MGGIGRLVASEEDGVCEGAADAFEVKVVGLQGPEGRVDRVLGPSLKLELVGEEFDHLGTEVTRVSLTCVEAPATSGRDAFGMHVFLIDIERIEAIGGCVAICAIVVRVGRRVVGVGGVVG